MKVNKKVLYTIVAVFICHGWQGVHAAKENASTKALKKLQAMVSEANAEKERLAGENAKLLTQVQDLQKQMDKVNKDKTSLEGKEKKLNSEIGLYKNQSDELRGRLQAATQRIQEVVDKYNALNQAKNELAAEHGELKNVQQFTSFELKRCETNNIKMFEGAKAIIGGYEKCQKKGLVDTVLSTEPFTQIKSVEFENLAQEYEDKLRKQRFQKTEVKAAAPAAENVPPNPVEPSTAAQQVQTSQ